MSRVNLCMSAKLATASLRNPGSTVLQCLSCDCENSDCFVSMKKKSMQKAVSALNSTVLCPVHQGRSSSKWARQFYSTLKRVAASAQLQVHGVVWDWHDVPGAGNHHMHIDACVFVGSHCARFEIDGEAHFLCQETARDRRDTRKDNIFRGLGVGLMHLHWRDEILWEDFIRSSLQRPSTGLQYTPSYQECLEPDENTCKQ